MEKILNDVYENVEGIIESLVIDDSIKEYLSNYNLKIYNLKRSNSNIIFDTLVDNFSQSKINIILDNILMILDYYNIGNYEIITYDYDTSDRFKKNQIIVINNFKIFKEEVLHSGYTCKNFFRELRQKECIFILSCENKIENYYNDYFNEKYFDKDLSLHIEGKDYTNVEIINDLKELYDKNKINFVINERSMDKIINNLLNKNKCFKSNCADYLYDYSIKQKIINDTDEVNMKCFKPILNLNEETDYKLSDLVGLANVKNEIKILENYLIFQKKLKNQNDNLYLNMFFMGNPGTGKTTVARIYGEILYNLGFINENKVIEIIPTDLMGMYVGHTREKTREILKKSKGGILFIDEAYLITTSDNIFMKEAVVELLKYLEDSKNVVIFSGYPIEMRKIYEANPGIKSRIAKEIYFEDYNIDELYEIVNNDLKKMGLKINKKTEDVIKKIIYSEKNKKNFGNARFCKQYVQRILFNHASKKLEPETFIIESDDVLLEDNKNFQIGFIGG